MTGELAEIAAAVAGALGLGKTTTLEPYSVAGYWTGPVDDRHYLGADGSNLFDPYWQMRARDWLQMHGYCIHFDDHPTAGTQAVYSPREGEFHFEHNNSNEVCARAIHALQKAQP